MNDTKTMSPLVNLQGVSKAFGEHHVLKGIDLQVHAGQVLGLLGKNGAGKSTLINSCAACSRRMQAVYLLAAATPRVNLWAR